MDDRKPPDQPAASMNGVAVREIEPGTFVLAVPPDPHGGTARTLERAAFALLGSAPRFVVLDLSELVTLGRAGATALVRVAERAGKSDIGLCLVIAGEGLRQDLVAADAIDLFEIHPSLDAALRTTG
jgi:anti-anti-sigma regulatory factor